MTISATPRRAGPFATNGAQTQFPFAFKVFSPEDVALTLSVDGVSQTLAYGLDYSVSLNADQDSAPGGVVSTSSAFSAGELTVTSEMAYEQPIVLTNNGGFYPAVFNNVFDRLVIYVQQLAEKLTRAALVPLGAPVAGRYLATDAAGGFVYASGTGADAGLREDLAGVLGGSLVTVKQPGVSAVARTLNEKLGDVANVKDDGAVGDGVANDDAILGAYSGPMTLPPGYTFLIDQTRDLTVPVSGFGAIKRAGRLFNAYQSEAGLRSVKLFRQGDLTQYLKAARAGSPRVAIVGDSNYQSRSQTAVIDSLRQMIVDALPGAIVGGFSIAGRGWGELNSDSYTGTSSGAYDGAVNFNQPEGGSSGVYDATEWPGGTTAGKSWIDHVKDFEPDLVIFGLGTNDNDPHGAWGAARNVITTRLAAWATVPSVILCTPPQTRRGGGGTTQSALAGNAMMQRAIAEELDLSLVDFNARSFALRGVDVVRQRHTNHINFADSSDWLETSGTAPVFAGSAATWSGAGRTVRPILGRDQDIQFTAPIPGSGSSYVSVLWGLNPANTAQGYNVALQGGGAPQLVFQGFGTSIGSMVIAAGANVRVRITVRGGAVTVRASVDGGAWSSSTFYDFRWPFYGYVNGYVGLEANFAGALTIEAWGIGFERAIGPQAFSDEALWGAADTWSSDPFSPGGNAANHPSQLGLSLIYLPCLIEMERALRSVAATLPGPSVVVPATVTDTATTIAATDYLDITINGSAASAGSVQVGTGLSATLAGRAIINVTNPAVAVPVRLQRNGANFLLVNVTVPHAGQWLITGNGHVSNNGAGLLRHGLSAVAMQVIS